MRLIDGVVYYSSGDLASIVNRTILTVNNWDKYSDILEQRGEERLIPKPLRINNRRLYTREQVDKIIIFSRTIKRGQLSEFNRFKWGEKGKLIDVKMKKLQHQKKIKQLQTDLNKVNKPVDYKKRFKYLKGK
jgi:hypothetical protein